MTVAQAVEQLLQIDDELGTGELTAQSMGVGVARLGQSDQVIVFDTLQNITNYDFGPPLHSLIIPASDLHFHESEVLHCFKPTTLQST